VTDFCHGIVAGKVPRYERRFAVDLVHPCKVVSIIEAPRTYALNIISITLCLYIILKKHQYNSLDI
jgi:hypothetical protein